MIGRHLAGRLAGLFRGEDRWDPRVVVVDTETSGLDPQSDELLAIGAVAVDEAGIRVGDSFEVLVRPEHALINASTVVHGIGGEMQRTAVSPRPALASFVSYVDAAPLVAFHAAFDKAVIERALSIAQIRAGARRWFDAAELAATLRPDEHRRGLRTLDDWLAHFRIETTSRHTAAGDAAATAELFLCLRALASKEGHRSHASLARLARRYRWL
jgi:DNA polymerase III subunit epsilon